MILECELLPQLDPDHILSQAFINRFFLNLSTLEKNLADPSQDPENSDLKTLKTQCSKNFNQRSVQIEINQLLIANKERLFATNVMSASLQTLYNLLTPLIEQSIKTLETVHLDTAVGHQSLLDQTGWFAQLHLLYNDMGILLGHKKFNEEETFPDAYLNFLAKEPDDDISLQQPPQETIDSSESIPTSESAKPVMQTKSAKKRARRKKVSAQVASKPKAAAEPIPDPPKKILSSEPNPIPLVSKPEPTAKSSPTESKVEINKPDSPKKILSSEPSPIPLASKPSSNKPKFTPAASKAKPASKLSPTESSDAKREIKNTRKAEKIKTILTSLGFEPIRKNRHQFWRHPETGAQVTVPRGGKRGEIPAGTVNSIAKQAFPETKN